MKISKIEFENFRNFRDHGEIKCSTDGSITIIYGKNGDGKTTLHQLFQWVFYGYVHFNKTTSDRLYNLSFENEQEFGSVFDVMGRIDFEHNGRQYSLTRKYTYKKGLDDSEKIREELSLNCMDDDNNWKRIDRPRETLEMLLPSGLSDYFFFDGESMIADLRVKGRDSAGKLKKALFSMFDLDVIDAAIDHIGRTDLSTSVLGKLYLSKGTVTSGSQISATKTNIENAQKNIERLSGNLVKAKDDRAATKKLVTQISEQIGNSKSKAEYERKRKELKTQRDLFLKNATLAQAEFGEAIVSSVPQLFVSKKVNDAKEKIHLKIQDEKLPSGINKKLIQYLLSDSTSVCICGNPLHNKEKECIRSILAMLPPKSFSSMYHDFSQTAQRWSEGYNREYFENYIRTTVENLDQASNCDRSIRELDEIEKKAPDIEDLIVARQQAEDKISSLDSDITSIETELKKYGIYLSKQMQIFDEQTKSSEANALVSRKISIMEEVLNRFTEQLNSASITYSKRLEENIQSLLDQMLTSKRNVSVSQEFSVRVTDSFNDESKSEGQFAVVSFAYIGGILRMLKSEKGLATKEYPLVLDGPFSKLDPDQRQNVINTLPEFAPQVILFSKDDINHLVPKARLGRIWTIVSNDEKNIAHVEEGFLWK